MNNGFKSGSRRSFIEYDAGQMTLGTVKVVPVAGNRPIHRVVLFFECINPAGVAGWRFGERLMASISIGQGDVKNAFTVWISPSEFRIAYSASAPSSIYNKLTFATVLLVVTDWRMIVRAYI